MRTYFRNLLRAFWTDEAAFKRWLRAAQASIALTIATVLAAAGTDADAIVAEIKTWTWFDYVIRLVLGFFFSSVHSPGKVPTMDEIHAEMAKRAEENKT